MQGGRELRQTVIYPWRELSGAACRTSGQEVCCARVEAMYVNVEKCGRFGGLTLR